MEKIESDGIMIPNKICNSKISNDAKYLYGWISQTTYYTNFTKTITEIKEFLQCSEVKARKCLKELKDKNFIRIYVKGNKRHIITTITKLMIEEEKINRKKEREYKEKEEEYNQWYNSLPKKEKEEYIKQREMIQKFMEQVK